MICHFFGEKRMIKTGRLPDYCVWDFNGTILDDVETGIAAVNHLLAQRGLDTIPSKAEYRRVFGFPIRAYYERLGFDFEKEPYEAIAPLWVEEYLRRVVNAPLLDGVKEALERFQSMGVRQVVLSATELGMLKGQLDALGITEYFEEIMGLDNIHDASKTALAKEWRERHPDAHVLLLGDTDHDYETARAMGAECILIAAGHQSEDYLRGVAPNVIGSLRELFE